MLAGSGLLSLWFWPGQSGFAMQEGLLRVSKIGAIRLVLNRPLVGTIKTLTVRRTPGGK
jgi:putative transposase